jgi:DNA mismatch repair protein MutH
MDFKDEKELINYAKKLEGLRFSEISSLIGKLDEGYRKHTKGVAAKVIETDYFGIPTNSSEAPDFEYLGIELKVSPLRYIERLKLYTTKERNVLKMVDYKEIANNEKWTQTKIQKKLNRILFVLYVHDNSLNAWDWRVVKVFIWSPSNRQNELIQNDYEIMRQNVLAGNNLREGEHIFFATCPKHGGGYLKDSPLESPRSSLAEHPVMKFAEKRGYCIKREAFILLIAESIGVQLVQKGRSIGIEGKHLKI